jgi:peroxiredoxin
MALVESARPELGSDAPDFSLPATDGETYSLESFSDKKALLVMFICNHCPYVIAVQDRLVELARDYQDKGLGVLAICSNDPVRYPADNFEAMKRVAREKGYPFPYAQDETQEVARAYGAECTPDFFLYDADRALAYRGRLDDNWKDPGKVERRELRAAIDALLQGEKPQQAQIPSMGCSIKWKY